MKAVKILFPLCFFLILVSCESKEERLKKELLVLAEENLKTIKAEAEESKNMPCFRLSSGRYSLLYYEYSDTYSFDIRKTDSITTPYLAVVNYPPKAYEKEGDDDLSCRQAIPQAVPPKYKNVNDPSTIYFAYQDGKWVLKGKYVRAHSFLCKTFDELLNSPRLKAETEPYDKEIEYFKEYFKRN